MSVAQRWLSQITSGVSVFERLGHVVTRWPLIVIALWLALPATLYFTSPPLSKAILEHPVPLVPASAPAMQTAQHMAESFHESGADNLLLAVLTDDNGLSPDDESVYRRLVGVLRTDPKVVMLQEFAGTEALRDALTSKDHKAWILPVGLAGGLDTPAGSEAYRHVSALLHDTIDTMGDKTLQVKITGPAATMADLTYTGDHDMRRIEIATAVLVLAILLIVYRNPLTMMLPLTMIGITLLTSRGVVAGLSTIGLGVSNETVTLMTAMMAGAGTDYAVFLLSRYHEELRTGMGSDAAVVAALANVGKVVAASAATVAVTFLCMSFAKLGLLATVGPALAITVGIALLGAFTLLPALMTLAGRRGWVNPRRDLTTKFWTRSGERIVKHPIIHLAASTLVLGILATFGCFVTFNWDESRTLPKNVASNRGYATLAEHFPLNATVPVYLVINSPHDLREPRALADLEVMAGRVAQVPKVDKVRGITRPNGAPPDQATVAYQAGEVGVRLQDAAVQIDENSGSLTRLTVGANEMAATLSSVREKVHESVGEAHDALSALNDPRLRQAQQIMQDVQNSGMLGELKQLAGSLPQTPETQLITGKVRDLGVTFNGAMQTLRSLSTAGPPVTEAELTQVATGSDQLAAGSQQLAEGVQRLVSATHSIAAGLHQASSFLLNLKHDASGNPAMGGFYIPPDALVNTDLKDAAAIFVSPDGHTVRYLIQFGLNPFSNQAMDQVNLVTDVAHRAQPNTTLSDASVTTTGFPAINRDLRDYYQHDMRFIMIATLLVVFAILVLLLRAIVAPLHLIVSVVISYLSALGLGVIAFQVIGHTPLSWSVPGMAFIVLVAVGADYNMLLISRVRDESPHSVSDGVIRTVSATGGVITSAGLIFAASMFGLLFGSINGMIQSGFIIGVGLLVDTFLVRTVTVPALAVIIGRANWWPTLWGKHPLRMETEALLIPEGSGFGADDVADYIARRRVEIESHRRELHEHEHQLALFERHTCRTPVPAGEPG